MTSRLVIAPNWIGDAVMSLPTIRALRRQYAGDRMTVLARPGPAAIYRAQGDANEVLVRASFSADVLALRARRFDEAWLLPNSMRAALLAFLSGASRRLGYATDRRGWLLTHAPPPPPQTRHQLRDYDGLLRLAGVPPDVDPPRLRIPDPAAQRAREAVSAAGLTPAQFAVLCPASASAGTKRWPPERFASLADRLAPLGYGCAVAVGPGEGGVAEAVGRSAHAALPVLGEDLDAVELAAVFGLARVVVSNDSGPAHLAAAVGTPVVAFFGPTDPGRTAPSGAPVRILDRYVFCSPCFLEVCPYGHECMREITVEMAVRAVEELTGTTAWDPSLSSG
ncbi:MAG: lipopolysaccharide heptosyltransferase II [Acidobacteriota bacterium]